MYKIIISVFLFLSSANYLLAQNQQINETPAQKQANKHAKVMQDSLVLTNQQRQKIFAINMDLYQMKSRIWAEYKKDTSLLKKNLKQIENNRDSLYKNVLPANKYNLYLKKKWRILMQTNL